MLRERGAASGARPDVGETRHWRGWLIAWLLFLPMMMLRAGTLSESDTFWQIRTGLLIIDRRAIPRTDPFSWTMHGQPWTLNSSGFDVMLGAAYRMLGLAGVALTCAVLAAGVAGLVVQSARRLEASPVVTAVLLVLSAPLLTTFLTARPQVIDYLAALASAWLLHRVLVARAPAWPVLAFGALSVCWANLHAGALLGFVMAGAVAIVVPFSAGFRRRFGWVVAAAAAALAGSLTNPYGIHLLSQTAQVQRASSGVVVEWRHLDLTSPMQLIIALLGVTALITATVRRDVVSAPLLAVAAAASVTAMRFLPVLLLLALPVLARSLSGPAVQRYLVSRRRFVVCAAALWLAAGGAVASVAVVHLGRPNPQVYSATVVRAIPSGCRGNLDAGLAGAGCVLVPPDSGLASRLDGDRGWRRTAEDRALVLYVRR